MFAKISLPKLNYTKHKAKSKVNKNWVEKAGVARNQKKETNVTVGRRGWANFY